jgi:hypothetical protein
MIAVVVFGLVLAVPPLPRRRGGLCAKPALCTTRLLLDGRQVLSVRYCVYAHAPTA